MDDHGREEQCCVQDGGEKRDLFQFTTVRVEESLKDEDKQNVTHGQQLFVHALDLVDDRHGNGTEYKDKAG